MLRFYGFLIWDMVYYLRFFILLHRKNQRFMRLSILLTSHIRHILLLQA